MTWQPWQGGLAYISLSTMHTLHSLWPSICCLILIIYIFINFVYSSDNCRGDRGYMLQISLFFTKSDGYDGNGFKFLTRCSPECDQIICTISGNWYLEDFKTNWFYGRSSTVTSNPTSRVTCYRHRSGVELLQTIKPISMSTSFEL